VSQPDFDYDVVDPNAAERSVPTYPVAQWHNGQRALKAAGGVQYTGGAVLPARYLPGRFRISSWAMERITFRSGKEERALTSDKVVMAPIRARFRWFARQGTETIHYPRSAYVMGAHMRGHLQVLAAIRGADEPIVATFKGKASQAFEALMKDFSAKVVQVVNRLAPKGKSLPRYAFWMSIAPGPHTKTGSAGQEAFVTLPTLALPADISRDFLQTIYVGRENLIRFQEWYREAEPWADAWEKTGVEHADSASEGEE
jgi:uncharacterized protein YukE